MNIAVISPHVHGNGNTTVAALIAASLAQRNSKVCLTHTRIKSEALFPYYSITSSVSRSNPIQVVNLIKGGGMNSGSVPNYCRNVSDRFDIFSLDSDEPDKIFDEDVADVIDYLARSAPHEYLVIDVDENSFDKASVKAAFNAADCFVLVLTQKTIEAKLFNDMKKLIVAKCAKKPVIVVVNKFRDMLGSIKDLATSVGLTNTRQWYTLHSNDNILYCENTGQLRLLSDKMYEKNGDVVNVEYDIQHIIQAIMTIKRESRIVSKIEREQQEQKLKKVKKGQPAPEPEEPEISDELKKALKDGTAEKEIIRNIAPKKQVEEEDNSYDFSTEEAVGFSNRRIGSESEEKTEDDGEEGDGSLE